jgi:hypothetical protein
MKPPSRRAPMANDPTEDVIATPEGDNEILPDEPLEPSSDAAVDGLETPAGSGDLPYKRDKT